MDNVGRAARRASALAGLSDALGRAERQLSALAARVDPVEGEALLGRIRAARAEVDDLQRGAPREVRIDLPPNWMKSWGDEPSSAL